MIGRSNCPCGICEKICYVTFTDCVGHVDFSSAEHPHDHLMHTLKGNDRTQLDFMCVTMIDPATSWFEIMELPVSQLSEHDIPMGSQWHMGLLTHKQKKEPYLDKTSATVGSLINRT